MISHLQYISNSADVTIVHIMTEGVMEIHHPL